MAAFDRKGPVTEFSYKTLNISVESGIARIELDKPPLNLIDEESTFEYHRALQAADANENVRVIILSGAGKGLSAGVDLRYLMQFESTEMEKFLRLFYVETLDLVRGLSKPIIAAVHGYAREGACTLAFACDMIIAADDADLGYPGSWRAEPSGSSRHARLVSAAPDRADASGGAYLHR